MVDGRTRFDLFPLLNVGTGLSRKGGSLKTQVGGETQNLDTDLLFSLLKLSLRNTGVWVGGDS